MLSIVIDIITILIIIYFIYNYPCNIKNTVSNYKESFENVIDSIKNIDNPIIQKLESSKLTNIDNKNQESIQKINNIQTHENYKIPEVEKNIKSKDINKYFNKYSSDIITNLKKNQTLLNDRYRMKKKHYFDKDLYNDLLSNEYLNELENSLDDQPNYNSLNVIILDNDIDSQILNKSKRCQKLFKDSKTIASRFNKNSLADDYNNELDYYSELKTPWWEENLDFD